MGNVVLIENSSSKIVVATTNNPIIVTSGTIVNINVPTPGSQQLASVFTANSTISSYQVLAAFASTVVPASASNLNHVGNVIGISLTGAGVGSGVNVVTNGLITNSAWSWDDTKPIFLDVISGGLIQDDPEPSDGAVFTLQIGSVVNPTTINVEIQYPILY